MVRVSVPALATPTRPLLPGTTSVLTIRGAPGTNIAGVRGTGTVGGSGDSLVGRVSSVLSFRGSGGPLWGLCAK